MAYSITRGAKLLDRNKLAAVSAHNFRIRTQDNINDDLSYRNRVLVNKLKVDTKSASSLSDKLSQYYEKLGVKERSNNVLMMEFVATASPEFFEGKNSIFVNAWIKHQVEFFEAEFGDNLKLAVVHHDEKTPHLHLLLSTDEKRLRRFKNRHGEGVSETVALNANRWNPAFFVGLHDRFAAHNAQYGLERGKRGSRARHMDLVEALASTKAKALARTEKQNEVLALAREVAGKAKTKFNEMFDDLQSLIDIVISKDLTAKEAVEVAAIAARHRTTRTPKAPRPKP